MPCTGHWACYFFCMIRPFPSIARDIGVALLKARAMRAAMSSRLARAADMLVLARASGDLTAITRVKWTAGAIRRVFGTAVRTRALLRTSSSIGGGIRGERGRRGSLRVVEIGKSHHIQCCDVARGVIGT